MRRILLTCIVIMIGVASSFAQKTTVEITQYQARQTEPMLQTFIK